MGESRKELTWWQRLFHRRCTWELVGKSKFPMGSLFARLVCMTCGKRREVLVRWQDPNYDKLDALEVPDVFTF